MNLNVDFNDELIKKYLKRGTSPVFTIYWTQDQAAYPEAHWQDLGAVILSWWLVAAKSLLEGAVEAELPFMDGPFRLHVRRTGSLLYVSPDDLEWQCRVPLEAFVSELVTTASRVQQKLAELNDPDAEGLRVGIEQLTATASGRRQPVNV